jgi:dihydrodipicolinate synthase/N-acetylneuraminate lyase
MLKGIFPVIPTLFTDDDDLDLEDQRRVLGFALEAGAHGVVFPGVASESDFLSMEERGRLMELVVEEVKGRVPIVGGASAGSAGEVIAAGQLALAHGIDHLMIMAPRGVGQDLGAQRAFFAEVTDALPGARIILQNAPSPIGAGLGAEAVAELAAGNEAIVCIKEETLPSGPAISHLLAAEIPHVEAVFGGGGARYIIDELVRGARGAMPAVEFTDLHVAIWNAFEAGDQQCARELYALSLPLLVSQAIYRMRFTKYVLERRGITSAQRVRAPGIEMDAFAKRDVDQMMEDLQASFA